MTKTRIYCLILIGMIALTSLPAEALISTRIKDICRIKGIRKNQLIGYGLVVGLEGSGDSSSSAAAKSIANFLDSFGVKVDQSGMKGKNIAAVCVTAELNPFNKKGDLIDVTISSIGDAKSLQGGILLLTPLRAANNEIYAVAQGPMSIGGFNASGGGAEVRKNHSTIGRIPDGAVVEREIETSFINESKTFDLVLKQSDFTTATGIAEQINMYFNDLLAVVKDPATIEVLIPDDFTDYAMLYIARIEQLPVVPDQQARIVINERTGTVLMGGPVKILPCAVAHGNLNVTITPTSEVSQPRPLSGGQTEVVEKAEVAVKEENLAGGNLVELRPGNSIGEVIRVLNLIGASPRDMISIMQSMKNSGALQAELVIM